jgi:hypothetical protein
MPVRSSNIFGRRSSLFDANDQEIYFKGGSGKITLSTTPELQGVSGSVQPTGSYRFDPLGFPIQSTQQIPLDWSDFANHTFFNSAEANVNMAFDTIINRFPFDGSRADMIGFVDSLTGFERWVYDSFSKNVGYLTFNSTDNQWIETQDARGYFIPELARNPDRQAVISPSGGASSLSFEMDYHHPPGVDIDNAVLYQKVNDFGHGFTTVVSSSVVADSTFSLSAIVSSGSRAISASYDFDRGVFNRIGVVYDRSSTEPIIRIFSGTTQVASSERYAFGAIDFVTASLRIGSGTSVTTPATPSTGLSFVPQNTLSGSIDDFRVFRSARTSQQISDDFYNTVYPEERPDLVMLYRFNEPTGSYSGNSIVLDSAGNGLHSTITGFSATQRLQSLGVNPNLPLEDPNLSPVLFPLLGATVTLNTDLLASASQYDANNPSLITRLIPRHFLLEASQFEGFADEEADTGDTITSDFPSKPIPGTAEIGSPQIISSFLFTMAKQFDEYKIFIDHFSKLLTVGYDRNGAVADTFLPNWGDIHGLETQPIIWRMLSMAQYYSGVNLGIDRNIAARSAKAVAAEITRRLLTNYNEILRSKGTRHSIEAVFRAIGVNPDTSIRIREFGGARSKRLRADYRRIAEVRSKLDMSGTFAAPAGTLDAQGFSDSIPFVTTSFLSASRTEVGFPLAAGTFVDKSVYPPHGISNDPNDGLLTSGSFTVESLVRFPGRVGQTYSGTQSLVRLHTTGANGNAPLMNLVATKPNADTGTTGSLSLYVRSIDDNNAPNTLSLHLTGVNVFSGDDYYVNFGRSKGSSASQWVTASYFLNAGINRFGNDFDTFATSSLFFERDSGYTDLLSNLSAASNASGSFLVVGSQSLDSASPVGLANTTAVTDNLARSTVFEGQFSELRFFSKALSSQEIRDHVFNPRSVGVNDPLTNFNFELTPTGSFERLRANITTDQQVTGSDATGALQLVDFSQNGIGATAASFEASKRIIIPRRLDFAVIEPRWDERSSDNKVRPRGYDSPELIERFDTQIAPVRVLRRVDQTFDDTRLSVEISLVRALNEDVVGILSTLDAIDKAIGKPEDLYTVEYAELERLRYVYFQRLTERIKYEKFFEFYNWFDTNIGNFISKMLPLKTDFLGTNFVVESHVLERHKIVYKDYLQYVGRLAKKELMDANSGSSISGEFRAIVTPVVPGIGGIGG